MQVLNMSGLAQPRVARAAPTFRQPAKRVSIRPARQIPRHVAMARVAKWREAHELLVNKGLQTVDPKDAAELVASGNWALVDVRPPEDHKAAHPQGAASAPLYQAMDFSQVDAAKVLKAAAFAFNGMSPTEPNPKFAEQVKSAAAGKKGVIFFCEAGGTMRPSASFPLGKASRSLQACYRAFSEGLADQVLHLDRGAWGWYQDDLPFTGDYKPQLGRTPNAVQDPTLKNVSQAVGYEQRAGDKPVDEVPANKGWFNW